MDISDPDHPLQRFAREEQARMDAEIAAEGQRKLSKGYLPGHHFMHEDEGHPILSYGQFKGIKTDGSRKPVTRFKPVYAEGIGQPHPKYGNPQIQLNAQMGVEGRYNLN